MGIFDKFLKKRQNERQVKKEYFIEFRFSGFAKQSIKELKTNITEKFGVTRRKIVPHITIAGPVSTRDEKRLLGEIVDVCKKYDLVKFRMDGFDNFEDRVIFVKINPSQELKNLRLDIAQRLYKFCDTTKFDRDEYFTFHATLVLKDIQRKFDRIWDYVQTWRIPEMEQYVLRITVIKNQKILAEYDLIQKKILNRTESLDKEIYQKTLKKLEKKRESTERIFHDMSNDKIHFFSDTHFDHKNIIKYCNRPFNSTQDMNQTLVKNWCDAVSNNDIVFFLGDMSYGRDRRQIDYWLGKLDGKISYIRGNHDADIINRANVINSHYGIKYNNYQFLLMHDPRRPTGYDGWIIHGDKHNNSLKDHPFINQKNKTVNVCAELVEYTPLDIDRLITLIETGRSYKTIHG
jgi:calcineurin-like phosphoesterase family protein/2'-5' RNA ligase